jgi:hypothetical protein
MKGYVNVLKERFTRKSLGNATNYINHNESIYHDANLSQNTNSMCQQANKLAANVTNGGGFRNSASKPANLSESSAKSLDYQRRRSASPFISNNSSSSSSSYSANPVKAVKNGNQSMFLKENAKKLFASTDDLRQNKVVVSVKTPSSTSQSPLNSLNNKLNTLNNNNNNTQPQYLSSTALNDNFHNKKQAQQRAPADQNGHHHYVNSQLSSSTRRSSTSVDHLANHPSLPELTGLVSAVSTSALNTNTNEVIKCTYLNEINKDELPRPNFVSSVKNLFEKQISNLHNVVSIEKSHMSHHHNGPNAFTSPPSTEPLPPPPPQPSSISMSKNGRLSLPATPQIVPNSAPMGMPISPSSTTSSPSQLSSATSSPQSSSSCSTKANKIENLVEILKQNGTLVYEHNESMSSSEDAVANTNEHADQNGVKVNNKIPAKIEPAVVNSPNRVLSFKERKEMFSKSKSQAPVAPSTQSSIKLTSSYVNANGNHHKTEDPTANKRLKVDVDQSEKENEHESTNGGSYGSHNGHAKDELDNQVRGASVKLNNIYSNSTNSTSKPRGLANGHSNSILSESKTENESKTEEDATDNDINNNSTENTNGDDLMDQMLMMSANQILNSAQEQQIQKAKLKSKSTVKMKTFYGGEEINDVNSLKLSSNSTHKASEHSSNGHSNHNRASNGSMSSIEYFNFEFVGAGVKLEKSILIMGSVSAHSKKQRQKKLDANGATLRVNFTDIAETYEYPSYEFMLKEMGIDPLNDPDYQDENENNKNHTSNSSSSTISMSSASFSQFLPGRSTTDDDEYEDSGDGDVDESSDYFLTKNAILFNTNSTDSGDPTKFSKLGKLLDFFYY